MVLEKKATDMSVSLDVLEQLPGGPITKLGIGIVGSACAILGVVLMPNLGGSPFIGKEVMTVGKIGMSGTAVKVSAIRQPKGHEVGMKTFRLRAGQILTLNYDVETNCGGLHMSVDKKGLNKSLPNNQKFNHSVRQTKAGQVTWKAPEDGSYRLTSYAFKTRDCDTAWTLSWAAES